MCLWLCLRILWDCLTYALGGIFLGSAYVSSQHGIPLVRKTSEAALEGDLAATSTVALRESNHFSKLHDHLQARISVY